jgi:hypothetical protein
MKMYGKWRYNSTILDFGTKWRWVVSFTPLPLYSRGESPWYSLDRKPGGPQSRSECRSVEKNLSPAGNRAPAIQPIAIPTKLSQLPTEKRNTYKNLAIKPEGKTSPGRPKCRCEDNVQIGLKKIQCEDVGGICLAQDMVLWQYLLIMVMQLWIPKKTGIWLTDWLSDMQEFCSMKLVNILNLLFSLHSCYLCK